ncbi:hypothetical protein AMECASPLE_018441 [Ameca splendens]|uniref:Uncharacterized protein n=1 Tax=Ameca splendens TaxID=208324 RepID=A0ABV0Y2L7_9TELE
MFLGWPGNALVFPRMSWPKWLGRGKSGSLCLGCCPRNPTLDKRKTMDGWMEFYSFIKTGIKVHAWLDFLSLRPAEANCPREVPYRDAVSMKPSGGLPVWKEDSRDPITMTGRQNSRHSYS